MSGRQGRPPAAAAHVYTWFLQLDQGRAYSGYGPLPLDFVQIEAWRSLTRTRPLQEWELRALMAMDRVRLTTVGSTETEGQPVAESLRPLSPQLFDAFFN